MVSTSSSDTFFVAINASLSFFCAAPSAPSAQGMVRAAAIETSKTSGRRSPLRPLTEALAVTVSDRCVTRARLFGRGPSPVLDFRLVHAFGVSVLSAFDDLPLEPLLQMGPGTLQPGHAVNHVDRQVEAIDLIKDRELQRRIDVAFLFVPAHMNVVVIGPAISKFVDEPRVSVEVEND